ncbi:hypothetical protein [Psychroflexus gondwanensis]|nr:hypothetical protein [Psychroflexus gondwanensis]
MKYSPQLTSIGKFTKNPLHHYTNPPLTATDSPLSTHDSPITITPLY